MGWLIDLAKAAIPKPMPEAGANPNPLPPLSPAAEPGPGHLWWRIAITEPGARTVEIDTPSGWTLADWQAYAEHYHGRGCAVTACRTASQATGTGQPRRSHTRRLRWRSCHHSGAVPLAAVSRGRGGHRGERRPLQEPPRLRPVIRQGDAVGAAGLGGQGEAVSYEIILADPPWSYRDSANAGKRGSAGELKYDAGPTNGNGALDLTAN